MIRRLGLRNWRAYKDLDLEIGPGTTFVVAPNGVGKTSLVYGLAWGVFGERISLNPKDCIRAGAESAEVFVELDLADERLLHIRRTARRRGAPTVVYEMDGTRVSEGPAVAEMERALGIELGVAGRLSMMLGGGHFAAHDALNLESHLHHAFGVAHLLRAAKDAEAVAKEAEKARAALRSTTKARMDDRAAMESEIAELEMEVAELKRRGAELERAREVAAGQRSLIDRHLALAGERERHERRRAELIGMIDSLLGRPVSVESNESIIDQLRTELETSERAMEESGKGVVRARSIVGAAGQALRLLDRDEATCPTCMRPLAHHERALAMAAHTTQQSDAEAEVVRLDEVHTTEEIRSRTISRLLARLEALPLPRVDADEDAEIPTLAVVDAADRQARADLDEHNQRLGGVQSRLAFLRAEIASDDEVREAERNLRIAYGREAAALAGQRVLREAADHVIESCIQPIADEVRGRWKHLFTNNGLIFKADGSITRSRDGVELGWDTLSGGERTWARIVTHLIVMGTTTSLPFAWFDEPLEHLDPQLRHAVAATLATATRGGSPRQLLVTTYEDRIARQLADDTDGAEIVTIRESEVTADPN